MYLSTKYCCPALELSAVKYATIQDAVSHITKRQNVVYMAKVDIESAFRIIPVRPADRPLLGFKWRDSFYMDAVLPMGCSSSCAIFEYFSRALEWVTENRLGISKAVHVIDDFLFLSDLFEVPAGPGCVHVYVCNIGCPASTGKTNGPYTLADKLSRSQINGFKTLAPWADRTPPPCPSASARTPWGHFKRVDGGISRSIVPATIC